MVIGAMNSGSVMSGRRALHNYYNIKALSKIKRISSTKVSLNKRHAFIAAPCTIAVCLDGHEDTFSAARCECPNNVSVAMKHVRGHAHSFDFHTAQ